MTKNTSELVFLPLGGSGEIGMNLNLYGYGPRDDYEWIMVDLGVTFGDRFTPGVEVIMPDPAYIEDHRDKLLAIVLTHAHEDHMGALARLWPRFRCPVYATPFTAWLVRDRLAEAGLLDQVELHEIPLDGRFNIGPFDIQLVTLTHSIPEPNGLAIRTPAGMVLHTGDWKIDPDPLIGSVTDSEALRALGEEGVLAMVCDSTNVFVRGESGSESGVREELVRLVGELDGKVAVASFASNVARMESAMHAAEMNDRRVCLVGRSMHRMAAAAKAVGLLKNMKPFLEEEEAGFFPADKVLYICTGSQGEARAALSRIADGDHRHITLGKGDTVVFSSRMIPGNEQLVVELQNKLAARGVAIVTAEDRAIHVSGHPARDELAQMYQWVQPRIAVPVHGEARHILEHTRLAKAMQIPFAIAPKNGDMILLSQAGPKVIDEVPAGRLHEDGGIVTRASDESLADRRRMAWNGHIVVAITLDRRGKVLDGPVITLRGMPHQGVGFDLDVFADEVADLAEGVLKRLPEHSRADDAKVEEAIFRAVRGHVRAVWDKRPVTDVLVMRVDR